MTNSDTPTGGFGARPRVFRHNVDQEGNREKRGVGREGERELDVFLHMHTNASVCVRYDEASRQSLRRCETENLGVDLRVNLRRHASDACEEEHRLKTPHR